MLQTLEGGKEPGQGKPRELEQSGLLTPRCLSRMGSGRPLCPSLPISAGLPSVCSQPHRALLALAAL